MGYLLEPPEDHSLIYSTFHVFQLRKYFVDDASVVPLDKIHAGEHQNYVEISVSIMDMKTNILHNKVVPLFKVQWQNKKCSEWTKDPESEMLERYPDLFAAEDFEDET